MNKRTKIKTIFLLLVLIIIQEIDSVCGQITANYFALKQMENTMDSSFWIQVYTYFSRYKFMIIIAAALLYKKRNKENDLFSKKEENQ